MNYVAVRILGMSVDHPVAVNARDCLHKLGLSNVSRAIGSSLIYLFPIRIGLGNTRLG